MQEYFYILEQLENLQIENKLKSLSKIYENKKVILYGANCALKAICSKFDLKEYFNIAGVCDDNIQYTKIFEQNDFKMISVQNLYFSGIDAIINLKPETTEIEKYLRKNHLIKKRVKFVNLFEKSFVEKSIDSFKILKKSVLTYKKTRKFMPIVKDILEYKGLDTITRLNYEAKINDLLENKKPIRVLFTAFDYNQWSLLNLYYMMRADERFKVLPILVLPNSLQSENTATEETIKYFTEQGIECLDGIEHDTGEAVMIKALKPDLIIYQQPQYLKSDYTPAKLSELALTCYVEPIFDIEKKEKFNEFMTDRLNNAWKIFTANNYSLRPFKNVSNAGFTLFEKYKQDNLEAFEKIWNIPSTVENNRIVYVPSFSICENFSVEKFLEQQAFMYDYISTHPQYSFVVIPDINLKQQCLDSKIITREEYENYFNKMNGLPNVTVKDYASAINIFKTSNILITDGLQTAVNYFPTGKPIIFINNKHHNSKFNELGDKIFKTFYKLSSKDALDIVIEDLILAKNDYNSGNRFGIIGKYNEYFNSEASSLIFEELKSKLVKPLKEETSQETEKEITE